MIVYDDDVCEWMKDIKLIKAMMMNLCQVILVSSYLNLMSSYMGAETTEPVGSPRPGGKFRPWLRGS
jgi:hypothetical protein